MHDRWRKYLDVQGVAGGDRAGRRCGSADGQATRRGGTRGRGRDGGRDGRGGGGSTTRRYHRQGGRRHAVEPEGRRRSATGDTVTWDVNSGDGQSHNAVGGDGPDAAWKARPIVAGRKPPAPARTPSRSPARTRSPAPCTPGHDRHGHGHRLAGHADADALGDRDRDARPPAHRVAHRLAAADVERRRRPAPARHRTTPAPLGSARAATPPRRRSPSSSSRRVAHGAKVSFTLSEPATVTIRVKSGSKTTVRTLAPVGPRRLVAVAHAAPDRARALRGRDRGARRARQQGRRPAREGAGDPLMGAFRPPHDAWSRRDFMRNGSYSIALVCTFGTT